MKLLSAVAARFGRLDLLEYAFDQDPSAPIAADIFWIAARYGHLEILMLQKTRTCPSEQLTCAMPQRLVDSLIS